MFIARGSWEGLLMMTAVLLFFIYFAFATYCTISENMLEIKYGFVYRKLIGIETIKRITEVNDIFGALALSIKRLQIQFNETESVAISPVDQPDFLKCLVQINPRIEIDIK
jgi:hypothetical protein